MGDGRTPSENGEAGQKFRKRLFRPENYDDPQNVSQEAGRNNSTGASEVSTQEGGDFASNSVTIGKSELEQMLKQMTFTRSETQHLMAVLHSRTIEESPSPFLSLEASTTSGSLKRHKHGEESDNFHASVVISRVLEEEDASSFLKKSVATPQHPTTMENLPDELLSNIFIRLLAKQLAQMRSVCKSWNTFLSQSSFIKSHLHRSNHHHDQMLLVFYQHEESFPDFKPFAAFRRQFPHREVTNRIKLPVKSRPEYTNGITVIGFANGLICSSYGDSVIHIWNPSLSAIITLPPYSLPSSDYDPIRTFFRFGFDPKTDDYKVVKLTGLTGPSTYAVKWWLHVEIYSMRKGTWEFITERFPSHITKIIRSNYVCVDGHDGHIYLPCCIGDDLIDLKTIVAFDLGSKTFHEILLPDSLLSDHNRSNELGVLSGKLCVTSQVDVDGEYEVWVMEGYGVVESWVKRHVFSQFINASCSFGFTSLGEFLIEDDGCLVVYDPIASKQEVVEDYLPEQCGVVKVVECADSLVWVTPAEHEMVDGGQQT